MTTPDPSLTISTIILGLGNPGEQYARSRHNIGAQCVVLLARRCGLRFDKTWGSARVALGVVADRQVALARPRTFMNQSGLAAAALLRRTSAPPDRLVVLCDDLDLPLGVLRLRPRGSTAGHGGLTSITQHIGTQDFPRLRLGISRPERPLEWTGRNRDQYEEEVVRWVLSDFSEEEEPVAREARERVVEALICLLTEGIVAAMNRYN